MHYNLLCIIKIFKGETMDFKLLEYILMISNENNITKAAQKLFISQSALNQQLLKLENELGTKLFYRSRTDWHPTAAGEVYIEAARKALLLKHDTYQKIYDLANSQLSTLKVGLTPGRGFKMFMSIYPKLHSEFPNLSIAPIEMTVLKQQQALKTGEIDIGFITLSDEQKNNDTYIDIRTEEIVFAMPKFHPLCSTIKSDGSTEFPIIDLNMIKHEPFAMMYKSSTNRFVCDKICSEYNFTPQILFETSSTASILQMIELGLCVGLIPRYYLDNADLTKVAIFMLPNHPIWKHCIAYRKDSYLSEGAKAFIKYSKEYCNGSESK